MAEKVWNNPEGAEPSFPVAVSRCESCAALIRTGATSKEAHNKFHAALAGLFDTVYGS